ncbi:PREDICTED: leucine-rich repeat-containing protein 34 isoform X3 [Lepidothrix coronata]|uniref:Leucine-rich repeat-containing protein 34 isoform X3 n=1 Tax=Lepidothrix coronata TaxID=321398 RepID=A0A6J0I9B8_9PASS|nr:PREDICTED: leucine-rich repeat-containing protein 34 isoform X3 [Lepidothrix coronata]
MLFLPVSVTPVLHTESCNPLQTEPVFTVMQIPAQSPLLVLLLSCHNDAVTLCFVFRQHTSVRPDLHLHYVQACQKSGQPENPFVAHVLQEADKNDEIRCTKGITLKIAGNNHPVPVQRVTDDDLGVLASVLRHAAFVKGLDLAYNVLTDDGAKTMATFLQRNRSLVHMRMTGNKIGNQGGMFFASVLQSNSTLQKLDLGDCDLGLKCLIAIATALTQNKSLRAINLNRPLLYSQEEETTVHIAKMLKGNSSLVELHLSKHEMKNFGVERLCEALYENSSLRYLDLSCNKITSDGVKFLGELLKRNQSLVILDLNANRIEDAGATYLSEALSVHNRTLQALSVVSCSISGKGLTALSNAIKANMILSYIYIWGNTFDEDACMSFSELIQMGRLNPNCTDVAPYEVDGQAQLAELSHGLQREYYWAPRHRVVADSAANASLGLVAVSEYL